jgi:GT2 family glycosyltransferase
MIKRGIFEQVGLMSEEYLMYGDDIDLSFKIKKAGYKVYYTNQSRVMHYGGRSTASWKQALAEVWIRDSNHKFLVKFRGWWYGALYRAMMGFAAAARLGLIVVMKLLAKDPGRRERLAYAFAKWKRLFQWAMGMKGWAKRAEEELGFVAKQW